MNTAEIADHLEIQQLTTRYAMHLSRGEADEAAMLFAEDAVYMAFGQAYDRETFPDLIRSAPKGQLIVNPPLVELDGDRATGSQHYVFITQNGHDMRLAWYTDEYVRTAEGWRFAKRSTTFLRRSGGYDSGKQHDPVRRSEP